MTGQPIPPRAVPLSVSEVDFLTLDPLPPDIARSVLPVLERRRDGSAVGLGTAFVIGAFVDGSILLATAKHNLEDLLHGDRTAAEPVVLLPGSEDPNHLIGFCPTMISTAETRSDVALVVLAIDDTVEKPAAIGLRAEQAVVDQNCLALGY